MACIHREISIGAPAEHVWSAIRDFGALHTRLVPGFVIDTQREDGARMVTFGNGKVVRELIVDVNDGARRIAWAVVGTAMTHHNASLQLFAENGGTRAVWIADLLPHELAPGVAAMIEQGLGVMKKTMGTSIAG
jgi:carbon monoxide dehydrogenase subunit G